MLAFAAIAVTDALGMLVIRFCCKATVKANDDEKTTDLFEHMPSVEMAASRGRWTRRIWNRSARGLPRKPTALDVSNVVALCQRQATTRRRQAM